MIAIVIMIKNESNTIQDTLLPFIQAGIKHFFVLDTGSTDHTVRVVKNFFHSHDVAGHIHEEPFIDFSASRNRALELAENYFPSSIFFLMPDAEWHLQHVDQLIAFCEHEKSSAIPLYVLKIRMGSLDFSVARLLRVSARIRFKGVVHEVPDVPAPYQVPDPVHFVVQQSPESAQKSKQRWQQDAVLLLKAHQDHPDDPRTVFYLAQTYECLGELKKAYQYYQHREKLIGWDEENFMTFFRLGCLAEKMSKHEGFDLSWSTAMDYFLKAFAARSHRIEPLVKIADYYWPANIPTCFLFIRHACDVPYPEKDMLFVEKEMYDYTRYEIMSRCAWYMGQFELGEHATLLALKVHPETEHLHHNLQLYQEKLRDLGPVYSME